MKKINKKNLEEPLKSFEARDPALFEELQEKLSAETVNEAVEETFSAMRATDDSSEILVGATERAVAETIVRPLARPVLVIRDNRATIEFLGPDSQIWASRIQEAQSILDRIIPAVGRIEVSNNPDFTWVGTGWLVAEDIIVTNRHVAREFAKRNGGGFTFRAGTNGGPMTSRIDFLEEDQRMTSLEYSVNSILWIAPSNESDVAFLRVTKTIGNRSLPPPIVLAEDVNEDDFVATIGYPARDSRVPDQDLVRRIFGDVYDKKRLAPGQVINVKPDEIEHDCSTLGGNSGSVLVNLKTGEAVGLHFSGLFMEANFAVSASKVRDLLRKVQQGELPGITNVASNNTPVQTTPASSQTQTASPGTFTFQMQIPVEITVKVGSAILPGSNNLPVSGTTATSSTPTGNDFENALRVAQESLKGNSDVIEVRLGYRFKRGWITDERVVVVEVSEKLSFSELQNQGKQLIPPQFLGVGVDVRTAALPDQLEHLNISLAPLEERASPGLYREPPNITLEPVKERMKAIFHVSPDSGFPNLKKFLGRVKRKLSATIFEWEAEHISDAIEAAISPEGNTLKMVTQRKGTRGAVADMKQRLGDNKFKHVWASVGAGKLIPSSYHIKVASRDDEEFWLSSGNWKNSNQADIDPAGNDSEQITFLRRHNREWHAIIENKKLARMFRRYIDFDFKEAQRVPLDEMLEVMLPDAFIPETAFAEGFEAPVQARYFDPLILDRELEIQPLLTPDRDSHGNRIFMAFAIEMMKKGTEKIYVENQSFNFLEDNNDEFEEFFGVLKTKQAAGVDVRIIFRDPREFGGDDNRRKLQKLLERLKDFGIDTDDIRVQKGCHTKAIIVDSKEVMLGSHNLTNEGSLFNRDASLLVRDAEVAQYFEEIFLFDWQVLSVQEADELVGGMRIAKPGEETPVGFRRVSLSELFGDS